MLSTNSSSKNNQVAEAPSTVADVVSHSPTRPVATMASDRPGPPLRFRFAGDRSRSKKRRTTHTCEDDETAQYGSEVQESSVDCTDRLVPITEGENVGTQAGHEEDDIGMFLSRSLLARDLFLR
jgi:hypothetical protein